MTVEGGLLAECRDLEDLGEQFVGAQPLSVVVDVGGDYELAGRRVFGEFLEACPHGLLATEELGASPRNRRCEPEFTELRSLYALPITIPEAKTSAPPRITCRAETRKLIRK